MAHHECVLESILFVALLVYLPLMHATPQQMLLAFGLWGVVSLPGAWLLFRGAPPFVPTSPGVLRSMMALADIKPGETVYDLGSGDGRLVFAAAKLGAQATGYELSVPTYLLAKVRSLFHPRSRIRYANFWRKDLTDANVIFCYLLNKSMDTFFIQIWPRLQPGTRVVSHDFPLRALAPLRTDGDAYLYRK